MSAWARVPPGDGVFCGGCGALLPAAAPVCWVRIAHVVRPLARCVACAGPAPPDLPLRPARVTDPPPAAGAFVPVGVLLPFDWRLRAAGREPGEEG